MKSTLQNPVYYFVLACIVVGLSTIAITGCNAPPLPSPTPSPAPTPTQPISALDLSLIQTGSTVATGAVLNFAVTQPASRTQLANQIYASASALYQMTGPTASVPTPTQFVDVLNSFSLGQYAQYASYTTALQALYQTYYTKYVNGSVTSQNISDVINAIAAGAISGASAYATIPAPSVSPTPTPAPSTTLNKGVIHVFTSFSHSLFDFGNRLSGSDPCAPLVLRINNALDRNHSTNAAPHDLTLGLAA